MDLPLGKFSYSIHLIFKEWPQSFCLYFLATARSIGPKKNVGMSIRAYSEKQLLDPVYIGPIH